MTGQQIFTTVYKHLLSQRAQSANLAGDCVYRGRNGHKCAIGVLISDEDYRPSLEGQAVGFLLAKGGCLQHLGKEHELLNMLQAIHDEVNVELWQVELKRVAKIFGHTV